MIAENIQPKEFRYTLIARGVDSYILPQAPVGWEESEIKWSRSLEYYGMLRTFTVPLEFVLDGAWVLRKEFYAYGLRADVQITIDELNPATWVYEPKYVGDIDFSTYDDSLNKVTATIMEAGITAMVKAFENVKYTIPIDVPEAIDVLITPLKLQERASFIFTAMDYDHDGYIGAMELQINETQALAASVKSVDAFSTGGLTPDFSARTDWFFQAQADGDLSIRVQAKGSALAMFIYDNNNVQLEAVNLGLGVFDFDKSYTIPVVTGQKLFFYFLTNSGGGTMDEGSVDASYFTSTVATHCKALRPKYVFTQLIKKMNGGIDYPVQSGLLTTWEQLVITSGNAIRQLDNPTIITSFKDFFQSINAVLNAGFGIESGKAVLEAKSYFFKPGLQGATLGALKDFNLTPYEPYIYNAVKVGYPDQSFSTIINGRDETNSTQQYSLPIIRIQKELNLLSVYRADAYGIEDLRITRLESDTVNDNNDNDVFFIKIKAAPESGQTYYQPERSEGYTSLTGVTAAETYYNWDLSPHRNLLRHGDFLHSMLDKYDDYQIKFESALKNAAMNVVDLSGVRTIEDDDLNIGTLPAKFFLPYTTKVLTKLPRNMLALIDNFPTGYVSVEYLDTLLNGYMVDVSVDIAKNTEREIQLLLTPYNQLLDLIH